MEVYSAGTRLRLGRIGLDCWYQQGLSSICSAFSVCSAAVSVEVEARAFRNLH
jgi:hypothetical protein